MTAAVTLAAVVLTAAVPDPKLPRVRYAVPLAVPAGFAGRVVLRGYKLDDITSVASTGAGVTVTLPGKGRKANPPTAVSARVGGDTELDLAVTVPPGFVGPVPLTVAGPGGRSRPFPLPLDPAGVVAEKEPNDGFAAAQPLTLPATVAGVIQGERDVDVFRLELAAGRTVRVTTTGAAYGSPAELSLTAWDAGRRIVAASAAAAGPEPTLTFTAATAGVYFVSVVELGDRGGPGFGYRLAAR